MKMLSALGKMEVSSKSVAVVAVEEMTRVSQRIGYACLVWLGKSKLLPFIYRTQTPHARKQCCAPSHIHRASSFFLSFFVMLPLASFRLFVRLRGYCNRPTSGTTSPPFGGWKTKKHCPKLCRWVYMYYLHEEGRKGRRGGMRERVRVKKKE